MKVFPKKMKKVYLAGPITGTTYGGCTDWREYAIKELKKEGITGVSPMRAKTYLKKEEDIADEYTTPLSCQKGITTRDRWDITSCDLVLANLLGAKGVSIGTVIELGWADLSRKPIILVMEEEGNTHDHAMIREIGGYRVESLDEGLYIAKALLSY